MKITLIQPDVIWEDKTGNLGRLGRMIKSVTASDIVILPEMFSTGFSVNTELHSEPPVAMTFRWMQEVSAISVAGVCGSYSIREGDLFFNRWTFVTPEGKSWFYDKRHLFTIDGEESAYTAGRERLTFSFRGVRILPIICYDLRFPVWSRNRDDYDLLINSANWPLSRRDVWITLLKARAIENQCYVAAANRIGTDGKGVKYCGESVIINPYGEIIASGSADKECTVSAEISMDELSAFRKKFPVGKDADKFTLNP